MYSADARFPILLCTKCRAGGLIAFDWHHSRSLGADRVPSQDVFEFWQPLKQGALYRCRACQRPWHLPSTGKMMTIVPEGRLDLILAWSSAEILLADELLDKLGAIGPTPPDIFGNGGGYVEIPCGVVTRSGQRIDITILSIQKEAPIEDWRDCRLASEVVDVYPSPFALPLDVRIASTRADEIAMGFAPSLIAMPDGQRFTLNGAPNFFDEAGYSAADALIAPEPVSRDGWPPLAQYLPAIYFIADG